VVGEILVQADVLILPLAKFKTPYRGMSSKLYEYQAAAKPIICCSLGIPKDYVEETNSGLVISPGDYKALAEAILKLRHDSLLSKLMGENGFNFVVANASLQSVSVKMAKVLERVTEKG
jgi:glycosyltransferase involved in cell wall biosynthesis